MNTASQSVLIYLFWEKKYFRDFSFCFFLQDYSPNLIEGEQPSKWFFFIFSETKYSHNSPWPAFTQTIHPDSVTRKQEKPGALKVRLSQSEKCHNAHCCINFLFLKYLVNHRPCQSSSLDHKILRLAEWDQFSVLQVSCGACGAGLGHEFVGDGPRGKSRFWIFSHSLKFRPSSASGQLDEKDGSASPSSPPAGCWG